MQHSSVPELAHTRTSLVHWVATAAALAAVVALSSFLQPDAASATASHPRPAPSHAPAARPVPAPDPDRAHYPLDCPAPPGERSAKPRVSDRAEGDLDGDGTPETVAVVQCPAGSGSPPDGVYVVTRTSAHNAAPRVVATLLDPEEQRTVENLRVDGRTVAATLLGYSTLDIPRCCPDVKDRTHWNWRSGTFLRSAGDTGATHTV
ncbi:hypothetical protein [Streptomyces sp. NPDC007088]|uniref:hypothetical protein n=1 Tax=Streptomyces sp. NPDC007088 TaxID=3364773 RepID=UPI0036C0B2A9